MLAHHGVADSQGFLRKRGKVSGPGAAPSQWGSAERQGRELGDERRRVACWREDFATPYRYDGHDGQCRSADGDVGRHRAPLQYVRETGDGECNDFASDAIAEALDWPVFAGWNLRGAALSRASMHFALMPDADLAGAQLDGFGIGYVGINGTGDPHTTLDERWVRQGDLDALHLGDTGAAPGTQPPYYPWRFTCSERPRALHCEDGIERPSGG